MSLFNPRTVFLLFVVFLSIQSSECLLDKGRTNGSLVPFPLEPTDENCDDGVTCRVPCPAGTKPCSFPGCVPKESHCQAYRTCVWRRETSSWFCVEKCEDHEFRCSSYQCINKTQICDGRDDCESGFDEDGCKKDKNKSKTIVFKLHDVTGLPPFLRLTSAPSAAGSTISPAEPKRAVTPGTGDEERSPKLGKDLCEWDNETSSCKCEDFEFRCSSTVCIDDSLVCDGIKDCMNGYDEVDCDETEFDPDSLTPGPLPYGESPLPSSTVRTLDTTKSKISSTEKPVEPEVVQPACPEGMVRCPNMGCLPNERDCIRYSSCSWQSQKSSYQCSKECDDRQFRCSAISCINITQVCDGHPDCIYGRDEMYCTEPASSKSVVPRSLPQNKIELPTESSFKPIAVPMGEYSPGVANKSGLVPVPYLLLKLELVPSIRYDNPPHP